MACRDVIFVVGTGRAGTSALTRILSLCGCTLPESVLGPADYNPKGSWEPTYTRKLTAEFLAHHGIIGLDPTLRLEGEISLDARGRKEYIEQLTQFLANCPTGRILLIKELAVTELWKIWSTAALRAGFNIKAIVPIRHPQAVTASFKMSAERGSTFWLKRNLLAERHTRGVPRVFVEYTNLLEDWRTQVRRVAGTLAIELSPDEAAIDEFLVEDLHHNRISGPVEEMFPYSWMSRTYTILANAARDVPMDTSVLDEIYSAFQACERTFRISLDEYRESCSGVSLQKIRQTLANESVLTLGRDF